MKQLLFIFLLFGLRATAQDSLMHALPLHNGDVYYSGIITADSVGRVELYDRVKRWYVSTYSSANSVIQLDDFANGEIIGKGWFSCVFMKYGSVQIWQTVSVQVKDNRLRYEIKDFRISSGDWSDLLKNWPQNKNTKPVFFDVDRKINEMITSLRIAVQKPAVSSDW